MFAILFNSSCKIVRHKNSLNSSIILHIIYQGISQKNIITKVFYQLLIYFLTFKNSKEEEKEKVHQEYCLVKIKCRKNERSGKARRKELVKQE